jgi:predicted metal-binding protein
MTSTPGELEALFEKHGYTDFKWIKPENIVVSQWVRIKCMFGCGEYGRNASCPPNVPSVSECQQFFDEYSTAVVFRFEKTVDQPEDRFAWTKKINQALLQLEKEVFLSGYQKAFLLFMDTCYICADCSGKREECKNPRSARPTPEAMAVDVFSTVRQYDYPIEVLSDYAQPMNRYAFLMVE